MWVLPEAIDPLFLFVPLFASPNDRLRVQPVIVPVTPCASARKSGTIVVIHSALVRSTAGMGLLGRLVMGACFQMAVMLHTFTALAHLNRRFGKYCNDWNIVCVV